MDSHICASTHMNKDTHMHKDPHHILYMSCVKVTILKVLCACSCILILFYVPNFIRNYRYFRNTHTVCRSMSTLATRLHLHRTAVCGKQWKVERERHGLEDFNSSEVVIR